MLGLGEARWKVHMNSAILLLFSKSNLTSDQALSFLKIWYIHSHLLDLQGTGSRPQVGTKIHICSIPTVSPLYQRVPHQRIQPNIHCKHTSICTEENPWINGSTQFKPILFEGKWQLPIICISYHYFSALKSLSYTKISFAEASIPLKNLALKNVINKTHYRCHYL